MDSGSDDGCPPTIVVGGDSSAAGGAPATVEPSDHSIEQQPKTVRLSGCDTSFGRRFELATPGTWLYRELHESAPVIAGGRILTRYFRVIGVRVAYAEGMRNEKTTTLCKRGTGLRIVRLAAASANQQNSARSVRSRQF